MAADYEIRGLAASDAPAADEIGNNLPRTPVSQTGPAFAERRHADSSHVSASGIRPIPCARFAAKRSRYRRDTRVRFHWFVDTDLRQRRGAPRIGQKTFVLELRHGGLC
jgi:hypothetical protein